MEKTLVMTDALLRRSVRMVAVPVLFATLVALGGHIRIPIPGNPVPLTLQIVFVLLAGAFLSPARAAASLLLFLGVGLAGAPVFSGGGAGLAYFFGPTGGYLVGFVAAATLCSFLLGGRRDSIGRTVLAMVAAIATIHLLGALYLGIYLGGDFAAALRLGVLPFLPVDVLKIATAAAIVSGSSALSSRK